LVINDNVQHPKLYYFAAAKDINLAKPVITATCKALDGKRVSVVVKSDKLARNVYISLDNADEHFSDNYFDLLPGEERTVTLSAGRSADDIQRHLKITSLIDSYNN
jgi:beta-mannosidase